MLKKTWMLASAIIMGMASQLQAGFLPSNVTVTPDIVPGNYKWTYSIVLPTDMQLQTGSFFTVYDFAGFVPFSDFAPIDWTFSYNNTGVTPSTLAPNDDPNIPNLTWTYSGPNYQGPLPIGDFWVVSQYNQVGIDSFTGESGRISDGKIDRNITTVEVPVPNQIPPVPEPATIALAGLGLPLLGLIRRRNRR